MWKLSPYMWCFGCVVLFTVSCAGPGPDGLRTTPSGEGPQVVWDLEALPLPTIPFPNDFATRVDAMSPTGRRLNVSMVAPTDVETTLRERAVQLDGFGTFAPIFVTFDAPLDLADLVSRQLDNDTAKDDAVLVINITTDSPDYGQMVTLDFGRGWLPRTVPKPNLYFAHDPRAGQSNLVFETMDEDLDGDGVLDPGEDTDGDGVLDRANLFPVDGNMWDDLLTFYERETDTLILRPVVPLRGGEEYAVVLTDRLRGEDGHAVRSPFPGVTLATQTNDLRVLIDLLPAFDLSADDIAFAWKFTTQTVTRDLEVVRKGLYGHGPLKRLADEFPIDMTLYPLRTEGTEGDPYVVLGSEIAPLTSFLALAFEAEGGMVDGIVDSFEYVSHLVFGTYASPNFMVNKEGLGTAAHPVDDDESWSLNSMTGEAVYNQGEVPFVCAIPKPINGQSQPFPVILHTTGTGIPKFGGLGYSGYFARHGLATCAIDVYAHGFDIPDTGAFNKTLIQGVMEGLGLGQGVPALASNRARDLDNDGLVDSGGDYWSDDPFHSRDCIRQTVVDWLQFTRILRGFDGTRLGNEDHDGDGTPEPMGDFDGDGIPDIGTEDGHYSAWGISLGGIVTGVLAGIEPKLEAAVPQSGGGGLTDIATRSTQSGVPEMVIAGSWGPLIVGKLLENGQTELAALAPHFDKMDRLPFAMIDGLQPGDRVVLTNEKTGESNHGLVQFNGGFRVGVPADALIPSRIRTHLGLKPEDPDYEPPRVSKTTQLGDALTVTAYRADGTHVATVSAFENDVQWAGVVYAKDAPLVSLVNGMGRKRQTPDFRQLLTVAQTVLEPADPVNWARHYFNEPLDFSYDPGVEPGCNVLNLVTVGDTNVPVAAGITLARAAGVLTSEQMDWLVATHVVEGNWRLGRYRTDGTGPHLMDTGFNAKTLGDLSILYDIDNLDEGLDGMDAPSPDEPLRATVDTKLGGKAGLRILYMEPHGSHGVTPPDINLPYSGHMYGINLMSRYLLTRGTELPDDVCLADGSCDFIPASPPD